MKKWLVVCTLILGALGAGIFYPKHKEPITSKPQNISLTATQSSNSSLQQSLSPEQAMPNKQPMPFPLTAIQTQDTQESKTTSTRVETDQKPSQISSPLPAEAKRTLPDLRCNQDFSDSNVAQAIGTTAEKLSLVKKLRALTNQEICGLPNRAVSKILSRLNSPKPDHPGDWASFRALQRKGDDGKVKPDGLIEGLKQRRAILDKAKFSASTTPTGAADGSIVMPAAGITSAQWTALGPGNIGGRIRAILIDRTNTNRIWLGSVSGGIWKSTDAGASWSPVNDFMGNLSISSLVMDPTNANILYAGTGEGFYNADAVRGAGIFKSTDGGTSWSQLSSTNPANNSDWYYVNRISIHPTDSTIVLAATNNGVYRSTNAGSTWSKVFFSRTLDISFDPNNGNKALLGGASGNIAYSSNAGASWTTVTVASGGGRVEVAYAKSTANTAYICSDQNNGDIYRTSDTGQTWTKMTNANHLNGQGWYDNTIWVDPTDANHLVVGGLDLYRSTNGGVNWTKISNWANNMYYGYPSVPHADHHIIISDPGYNGTTNRKIYNGNDGGIFRSNDITLATEISGWTRLNNGLYITQFYGAAGSAANGGRVYGGTQDNGSLRQPSSGTNWAQVYGGDGGYAAVDPLDANYLYGEYVYLAIHRATNGATASDIYTGITDAENPDTALFIAPFILDPNNSSRIYAGGKNLWISNNVKAATPTWSKVTALSYTSSLISAIAVAEGNDQIIWVGYINGMLYRSLDGGASWTAVNNGTPSRMVTRILIDKTTPTTAYVAYGGYYSTNLYKTTNSGSSWTSIHGNLPSVPVFGLARHPTNSSWLYAGTEVGLFTSTDGGVTWGTTNDGPANVEISELFWLSTSPAVLVAATHGRGVFKVSVDADQKAVVVTRTGTGSGTVTSEPAGISCGANCTANFPTSSEVTLTATADSGSIFTGWSGGSCSGTGSCIITLTDNTNVTAEFTRQFSLSINHAHTAAGSVNGGGSISGSGISCSSIDGGGTTGTCSGSFSTGSTVTLAAAADANSTFSGWSGGGCSGTGGCSFSIAADTTVTGTFAGAYKAKIDGGNGYDTLTLTHSNAGDNAIIRARELHNATTLAVEPFVENLTVTKPITLKGGYNAAFSSNTGLYSTLAGLLTISSGSLTVENLVVK